MIDALLRTYFWVLRIVNLPLFVAPILWPKTGSEHDISMIERVRLVYVVFRNYRAVDTEMWFTEVWPIVIKALKTPPEKEGVIVECGCYTGGLTATLSYVAELTSREVHAFDTFEGMPKGSEPSDSKFVGRREGHHQGWDEGEHAAALETARENISRYGVADNVSLHVGLFEETLPRMDDAVAMVVVDADYEEAARTCLANLWSRLRDGCYYFSHGIRFLPGASVFYDREFWQDNFSTDPPGIVGAGAGLGLNPSLEVGYDSFLGYAVKNPLDDQY